MEESSEGVLCCWWSSQPAGRWSLLGSGLISDITDLGPGGKRVEVEEAYSPGIDGHHHCHQANDIDPQASFHLQDTTAGHTARGHCEQTAQVPRRPPPEPVLT